MADESTARAGDDSGGADDLASTGLPGTALLLTGLALLGAGLMILLSSGSGRLARRH